MLKVSQGFQVFPFCEPVEGDGQDRSCSSYARVTPLSLSPPIPCQVLRRPERDLGAALCWSLLEWVWLGRCGHWAFLLLLCHPQF